MEFRDCFVNKIDDLQHYLCQTIVDKAVARQNNATSEELRHVEFNLSMWQHYLIKAIFVN